MTTTTTRYVHGYDDREGARLLDQAAAFADLFHHDTRYADGSHVLEAGCGVGGQTVHLARNSPGAFFTCVDISKVSLEAARRRIADSGYSNVTFQEANILELPFAPESFDHVFVCFVLEHLVDPVSGVQGLLSLLKPGGSITVIECDHGGMLFHPASRLAHGTVECLVELQRRAGGNAHLGRSLYPLLTAAGVEGVAVTPRSFYVDGSRPELMETFIRNTLAPMMEGVREASLDAGLMTPEDFDEGIRGLHRLVQPDGVFCYTFFKAVGVKGNAQ